MHTVCSPSASDNVKVATDDGMGSMCSTHHFGCRLRNERAIMKKVRKTGYDAAKWIELPHDMVRRRTFVSRVMNFLASNSWITYSHSQCCIIFKSEKELVGQFDVTAAQHGDLPRAGRSGDRIPVGARFSAPVQSSPGAHPASCTTGTQSLSRG